MHISDGIISTPVCVAAHAASMGLIYLSGRKTAADEVPGMGMTGAALFVVSLIQFPLAGTSVHPGMLGLTGIILGKRSFPVVFTVLLFQSLIFQHGGLLTLGLNSLNLGAGAFLAWIIWRISIVPESARALLAGFAGVMIPATLMLSEFLISGYDASVFLLLLIYALTATIEAAVTLAAVKFFRKVKPDIIGG
jgi:cobalt/nickel transport system permease protein